MTETSQTERLRGLIDAGIALGSEVSFDAERRAWSHARPELRSDNWRAIAQHPVYPSDSACFRS